jgi:hypothetical protein
MVKPKKLLERLEEIGRSLANTPGALALLGLGSSGREVDRMDTYSDLDFFVLVETGYRQHFLNDLSWLGNVAPIAFQFMNTEEGYKLLFEDGIFCDFAVFEPDQFANAAYADGQIIWQALNAPKIDTRPAKSPTGRLKTKEWLLGEAITNLYVGLGRERRGEKLSAQHFIQGYAVDRITELAAYLFKPSPSPLDVFDPPRRFESRYPTMAPYLSQFIQGYEKNCESALAILNFLDYHFDINQPMKAAIIQLIQNDD